MYQRYYDSYDNCGKDIQADTVCGLEQSSVCDESALSNVSGLLSRCNSDIKHPAPDDILLIGVLLLLLLEGCDDSLMIIIIGFVLLSGFVG